MKIQNIQVFKYSSIQVLFLKSDYLLTYLLTYQAEVIEYIRIRIGFESFSSNLEYLDSDSTIF